MDGAAFEGRRVLVTGASRGIGRAVAVEFVRAGADVAITGRKMDSLAPVAEAIVTEAGRQGRVLPIACHQGRESEIQSLFENLDRAWGRIDIAVINAATNPVLAPLVETEKGAWD